MSLENALLSDIILIFSSLLVGGGSFICFRRNGCTLSEAGTYGLMALLMVQSWLGQVLLMVGAPSLYVPLLLLAALPGLRAVRSIPQTIAAHFQAALGFSRAHPLAVAGLLTVWGYSAVTCAWPKIRLHGHVLESLYPLWRYPGSLFTLWHSAPNMALPVLNHTIFTAPWQPPLAIAMANMCAYLIIGLGTYALSRRYAWPPMAITVTLLVVSMTRLVHQSITADSELLPAAAGLTAIVALYRSVERPHGLDLTMLVSAVAFSVSGSRLCYLMPAVLFSLSLVLLGRRHGIGIWRQSAGSRLRFLLASGVIVAVFSQAAIVGANLTAGQAWIGATPLDRIVFNPDALSGTIANLARYLILAIDLPDILDRSCRWVLGFSPLGGLKLLYHWAVAANLDGRGAAAVFDWSWAAPHKLAWFGPAGFFLVIPSLIVALLRGPRRLKSTALAMLSYWVLIALIVAWRPENTRLMTVFFVCSGFFMAFAMPPWRLSRTGRLLLQLLGVMIMAHAILS